VTPEEEERRWQELRARWGDEEAHRSFLAAFQDIEGLARAGRRYRDAIAAAPDDAVAARWRDEVVKRATVAGLASLPRTPRREQLPRWAVFAIIAAASTLLALGLWWGITRTLALYRSV
jgi:hypothetical protein